MGSRSFDLVLKYLLLLLFIVLASNSNFRSFDTAIYLNYYKSIPDFRHIVDCLKSNYPPVAPFFKIVVSLVKSFDGTFEVVAVFFGIITCVVFFYAFAKVSSNFYFTLLAYTTLYFYFLAMGQIRQGVALSFVFMSINFLIKKRLVFFILNILVATFFHYSAIIFLPIYFINRLYISRNFLAIILFCSVLISLLTQDFSVNFINILPENVLLFKKINVYSSKMVGEYNLLAQVESVLISSLLLVLYNNSKLNNAYHHYNKMAIIFIIGTCGCLFFLNYLTVLALRGFLYYKSVLVFIIPMFSIFFEGKRKLVFYTVTSGYLIFRFIYKLYMLNFF